LDETTPGEKDLKYIEELRADVSGLFDIVVENEKVGELGTKAVKSALAQLSLLRAGAGFTEAEQKSQIKIWQKLVANIEKTTRDLEDSRMDTLTGLRAFQKQENFIKSMIDARRQQEVIDSIRELALQLKNYSKTMNDLVDQIPTF
jgi:hypothetical protein